MEVLKGTGNGRAEGLEREERSENVEGTQIPGKDGNHRLDGLGRGEG
jgi:hypothetical protein